MKSAGFVLTSGPHNIVVRSANGITIFDASAVAKKYFDFIVKNTAQKECPHLHVTEQFKLESMVGPFLSLYQSAEIDCMTKGGDPIGAHPTVKVRYVVVDCRDPEDIAARDWSSGDFTSSPRECWLQSIFSDAEIAHALKTSAAVSQLVPALKSTHSPASLGHVGQVIKDTLWSHGASGGKGLMNRFRFDKVADDKVETTVGIEQYGAGSGILDCDVQLTMPSAYQKDFEAASNGSAGVLYSQLPKAALQPATFEFKR